MLRGAEACSFLNAARHPNIERLYLLRGIILRESAGNRSCARWKQALCHRSRNDSLVEASPFRMRTGYLAIKVFARY